MTALSPVTEAPLTIFDIPGCEFTSIGLTIAPGMQFGHWERLGRMLRVTEQGVQWWIGDWIRYGEHEYGNKYAQAIAETGYKSQTLTNYVFVSENVPISRRRENVDFSTHAEVASLPAKEQNRILNQAAANPEMTVRDVRKEAARVKRQLGHEKSEVQIVHTPEVQEFLLGYVTSLKEFDERLPLTARFLRNMIHAHIGQAQWQAERTIEGDGEAIIEFFETAECGTDEDIFIWLQRNGYFMRDPELDERLAHMVTTGQLKTRKQGGRKETQRGDMVTLYMLPDAVTGDFAQIPRARSNYEATPETAINWEGD